jgi:hypothetical protein
MQQIFSPPLPPFLCVSKVFLSLIKSALLSRRRLSHRHHHQPRAVRHKEKYRGEEIFAQGQVLKPAPQHAANDQQVNRNVSDKDFGA